MADMNDGMDVSGDAVEEGVNRLVLIADGNTARGKRLAAACEQAGVPCKTGPHGAAALEMALNERPGLVVAQLDLPLVNATKLAEILRANPRTRRSRFLFLGDQDKPYAGAPGDVQLPSGTDTDAIVRAIEELIGRQDRLDAVDRAAARGEPVEGDLALVGLPDLLGLFQVNRASGRLRLEYSGEDVRAPGVVLIRDGDVLQAECGTASNEKALFRLFAWRQGRFDFTPGSVDDPAFIATSTRLLLQEGMRQLEEWDRLSTKLPPLDSRVRVNVSSGELPNIVHPLTQEVMMLLELYSTVREVVDHCTFPDYQVLRTIQTLSDREIVDLGRVPVSPTVLVDGDDVALFNEAQIRRLREWIESDAGARDELPAAKLIVAGSDEGALPDFARLLARIPGATLSPEMEDGGIGPGDLAPVGTIEVEPGVRIELIHVPRSDTFAPLWALAGHRALGTLFLLGGRMADAADRVSEMCEVLAEMPRARTFHVALLRKSERISPEELRENLSLIDEASLFLLPVESTKPPADLLRGLFSRIVP
jgi:CheY-like chemotaxis protein